VEKRWLVLPVPLSNFLPVPGRQDAFSCVLVDLFTSSMERPLSGKGVMAGFTRDVLSTVLQISTHSRLLS
jgi:hypothetical protein